MNAKVEFGVDFLSICRDLIGRSSGLDEEINQSLYIVADAAARLFLLEWGLTVEEGDRADALWWERFENDKLDEIDIVVDRVIDHFSQEPKAKERILIQLVAITYLDYEVTDGEQYAFRFFSENFDLRPSEEEELIKKGFDLAIGLNYFGDQFSEAKNLSN